VLTLDSDFPAWCESTFFFAKVGIVAFLEGANHWRKPLLMMQKMLNCLLGIDKKTTSRNERSDENAKKAPAEENRTRNIDTMKLNVIFARGEN